MELENGKHRDLFVCAYRACVASGYVSCRWQHQYKPVGAIERLRSQPCRAQHQPVRHHRADAKLCEVTHHHADCGCPSSQHVKSLHQSQSPARSARRNCTIKNALISVRPTVLSPLLSTAGSQIRRPAGVCVASIHRHHNNPEPGSLRTIAARPA